MKLDHIAMAVKDLDEAVARFEGKLGLPCERIETVESEGARVAFFDVGGAHLELVAPLDSAAPIARSIEKRGEGLHHLCLAVDDLDATLATLKAAGVRLVNEAPVAGARGRRIAFVHPSALSGLLLELVEEPEDRCEDRRC